jgi:hypothetical protein
MRSPLPSASEAESPRACNVITDGIEPISTSREFIGPGPQLLFAVTEIVPPFEPTVAVIEFEAELPLHPDGNVQVYDVAPDTAPILYVRETP